jgi:hypothetical protein
MFNKLSFTYENVFSASLTCLNNSSYFLYLFHARTVPGSLNGGQTNGSGQLGILSAIDNDSADFSSHDTQVTKSLQNGDDFNFILGVSSAPVAEHFAQLGRKLKDFGAGLALLDVFTAVATGQASQTEESNG